MTNISVATMIALAQLAGTIEPLPIEPWELEPIVIIQDCLEPDNPFGLINLEIRDWCYYT